MTSTAMFTSRLFSQRGDKAEGQGKGCLVKEVTRLKAKRKGKAV